MFHKDRIKHLEWKDTCIESRYEELNRKYWELRRDVEQITKHLGVKFEDINKRVLVKTCTTPTSHDPDLSGAD